MTQYSLFNVVDGQVLLQKCTQCVLSNNPELVTNCMSGVGHTNRPDFMFIGKAPGDEDDKEGEPMTGKNGRLFHEILKEADIDASQCYIDNCLKCSPYGRKLTDKMFAACKGHLRLNIQKIKPKCIVAVGGEALKWLTGYSGVRELRKTGIPCVLDESILVFPILQPAGIWHVKTEGARRRLRNQMVDDLKWLKERARQGKLYLPEDIPTDYQRAESVEQVRAFLDELNAAPSLALDTESATADYKSGALYPHPGKTVCTAIGFSFAPGMGRAIPWDALGIRTYKYWSDSELEKMRPWMKDFLSSNKFYGHNIVQHDQMWTKATWDVESLNITMDTMYAYYTQNEEGPHGLEYVVRKYTTMPPWKKEFNPRDTERLNFYLCKDVDATCRAAIELSKVLSEKQWQLMQNLLVPAGNVLREIQERGFYLSESALDNLELELKTALAEHEAEMRKFDEVRAYEMDYNSAISFGSDRKLGDLFEKYLKLPKIRETPSGNYSVNADVLEAYKDHKFVQHLQAWRRLDKIRGTYCDGPRKRRDDQGAIHISLSQLTKTGRLKGYMQNLPREATSGRVLKNPEMVKEPFCARDGYVLLMGDFSQVELRTLALYSRDPVLMETYRRGEDVHRNTAAAVYGVPPEQVTSAMRNNAKPVNFGIIYGKTLETLKEDFAYTFLSQWEKGEMEGTKEEVIARGKDTAQRFWEGHKRTMPKVWEYMDLQEKKVNTLGEQETFEGRKRRYAEVNAHAIRQAYNFPIQSNANDFTLYSMIRTSAALKKYGFDAYVIFTVHDSIIFEVKTEQLWEVAEVVKYIMENLNLPYLDIPLKVDFQAGFSWGKLKAIDLETQTVVEK